MWLKNAAQLEHGTFAVSNGPVASFSVNNFHDGNKAYIAKKIFNEVIFMWSFCSII